jgi:drug/metabolite transporter (DMT)-like permease
MLSSKAAARALLVGSALSFGTMAVLARSVSRGTGDFTAAQLSVVRFAVGVLLSLVVFGLNRALYRPHAYGHLIARGLSGAIVVVLYFRALARIPAAEAGMLYNLFPVIATAMSIAVFRERPTIHLAIALFAATVAVGLVLGDGRVRLHVGSGEISALGAALFAAASANIIRGMRSTDNAPTIFFFFSLAGLLVVLPFALDPWPTAPLAWAIAAATGLAAFAGQVLMTQAYGALSVAEAAVWLQLTPIAQMVLAIPLLGEPVRPAAVAGILLGVSAVAYGTVLGHRPTRALPAGSTPTAPPPS